MATFAAPDVQAALNHPVDTFRDTSGYAYDSTSQLWKTACAALPSCAALQWPGYATTCIETKIGDRDVVIQPWMGHCQQFLGRTNFPGGFGGEVGVYVKVARGSVPDSPMLPRWAKLVLEGCSLLGAQHLWWPDAAVQPTIEFTIINPIDHSVLVRAPQERNYWVNRRMQPDSLARYRVAHHVPDSPTQYKMVFTVAGFTRAWTPSAGDF